jgi:DNA-binding MurR/RpiR family transcriptional regulator
MQTTVTIKDRISSQMDQLSPQLRRAAHYVAEHPEEVATRSLRYLTSANEMTPPTFSRMAKALGFTNYEALRDTCREQVNRERLIFTEKTRVLQEDDGTRPEQGLFILRQGAAAVENIDLMVQSIDPVKLETVANQIISARRVLLVGMMSSRPFVDYMAYMASMAFDNWQVLRGGTESNAATLSGLDQSDLAIVISKAPYARRSIEAAKYIRLHGTPVIGITDEVTSPLGAHSDTTFFISTESPQFFTSHVATLVFIESLMGMVVSRSGEEVSRRITSIENESHRTGEYFSNRSTE